MLDPNIFTHEIFRGTLDKDGRLTAKAQIGRAFTKKGYNHYVLTFLDEIKDRLFLKKAFKTQNRYSIFKNRRWRPKRHPVFEQKIGVGSLLTSKENYLEMRIDGKRPIYMDLYPLT